MHIVSTGLIVVQANTYRETALLAEVECNITHVSLDLAESQGHGVVILVLDGRVGGHLHVRLSSDFDDIGEEIAALERQVFDHKIHLVVGVFDTRNGDVANLLNESWNDDLTDIFPQLRDRQYLVKNAKKIYILYPSTRCFRSRRAKGP